MCVGPAHQVATACVLAPHRRSALLAWARRAGGMIVEDDYDSEFSYDGPALPTMHGSDPDRVALLGSMSRTLTPTVNVGWVVAALARELPECRVRGAETGLHVVLELPPGSDRTAILMAAERRDIGLCDIFDTMLRPDPQESRMQIGFANLADTLVDEAIGALADVIRRNSAT